MNIRKSLIAGVVALGVSVATATAAQAAPGVTYGYPDAYGAFVNTTAGRAPSATATSLRINWDTNAQYATVAGSIRDSGRGDGKLAGLFAQLVYSDGSQSDWKLAGLTGNETTAQAFSRHLAPGKQTVGIRFVACQANQAGTPVGGCGAVSPLWDNPYQNNPWDPYT